MARGLCKEFLAETERSGCDLVAPSSRIEARLKRE
jgi:hypothetical protein